MNDDVKCLVVSGDPVIMIRIESADRVATSLPYFSLLALEFYEEEDPQKIIGHFSMGVLEIAGHNLERLLKPLEGHLVQVVRKGRSDDEIGPKIKRVIFKSNKHAAI
jgi:hypothetical protein